MRQIIQNYNTGGLKVEDVPAPQLVKGRILVQTSYSLISAGTEKTKIDTAKKSLLGKAKSRPDLVKKVIDKAKKEGLWKTWQTVNQRLNEPISLGYSCSGEVLDVAGDVNGLRRGDLVACGGGAANHSEIISVPKNLVVRVPTGVGLDHAAFATMGAIAMQGVRQADVRLGERVAVIGLGLIGLLVTQILKASGCQVIGIDLDPEKVALGKKLGCHEAILATEESMEERILVFTDGYGVDSTILTAGTRSNRPIEQAGELTREKGRVVVLGAVGMDIPREPYYLKEIDLRLSRSYGPGRYDMTYEEKGHDYPFAYVRFTEQRNMHSFLELVKDRQVDLDPIITHRFQFDEAPQAYNLIHGTTKENYIGILLEYNREENEIPTKIEVNPESISGNIVIGVIGAGHYVTAHQLPHIKSHPNVSLGTICTATGMTALDVAEKFGFKSADSDVDQIISESDAILIGTRHNDHARYGMRALEKGKPVFVEKPLCITVEELGQIVELLNSYKQKDNSNGNTTQPLDGLTSQPVLMVGFNRRFSPAIEMVKEHFQSAHGPKQILIRVNAGPIPVDHWIQDLDVGGGRLVGEACHFVDLVVAITGTRVETVSATAIPRANRPPALWDDFSITLGMSDGSVGTIVYTAIGDTGLAKEYVEVFSGGKIGIIHDFRRVECWSNGKKKQNKMPNLDKGQKQQMNAWIKGLQKGESPIPFQEIINVHQACFAAVASITNREMVKI
ncbi:MAG: bi-domain-containing oxidoreductase [Deltaproteobacteria bacterium]|jgi:polar amino acid transport system substrate-binding protein|nr:bi-domain-containing oxidoreductase [Deltaproteobacteria bacterium]